MWIRLKRSECSATHLGAWNAGHLGSGSESLNASVTEVLPAGEPLAGRLPFRATVVLCYEWLTQTMRKRWRGMMGGKSGDRSAFARRANTTWVYHTVDPSGNLASLNGLPWQGDAEGFDAYGNPSNPTIGTPFQYQGAWGGYTDSETGLVLQGHRYYDPATGTWLTRDPIGQAGGVNVYGYVGGDPVNWNDEDGLKKKKKDAKYNPRDDFFGGHLYRINGHLRKTKSGTHYAELIQLQAALVASVAKYTSQCTGRPPVPATAPVWVAKKWPVPCADDAIRDESGEAFGILAGERIVWALERVFAGVSAGASTIGRLVTAPAH